MTQQKKQRGKIAGQRYWQAHVAAFGKSGLSRAGYCQQHNLSTHAMVYWQKKFKQTEKSSTSRLVPVVVPVAEATVTSRAGGLQKMVEPEIGADSAQRTARQSGQLYPAAVESTDRLSPGWTTHSR